MEDALPDLDPLDAEAVDFGVEQGLFVDSVGAVFMDKLVQAEQLC